jgi:hypothetical protein
VCGVPNSGGSSDGQNGGFMCTQHYSINGCEYSYVNTYKLTTTVVPLFHGIWTQPPSNPKGCPKASNLGPIKIDTLLLDELLPSQSTFTLKKGVSKTPLDL